MKLNFFIFVLLFFTWKGYTQDIDSIQNEAFLSEEIENSKVSPRNQVKVNLASLFWSTASFNYERRILKRWTIGLTANYRPMNAAPFGTNFQDILQETNTFRSNAIDMKLLEYGNWSINPELKFYLGKTGAFKGFYIAGFAKYEDVEVIYNLPVEYEHPGYGISGPSRIIEYELPLKGSIKPWSGGIYIGNQWQLGKNWYIDWQIIGANFGGGTLDVAAIQELDRYEQEEIESLAQDIQNDFHDVQYEVTSEGARIWGNIPWAGLRTGLSIGFTF